MILAIGNSGIHEVDAFKAVAESLQRRGCDRVVLFKQDKCLEGEYFNCDASNSRFAYSVTIDGKQYNVEDFSAVWYLKPHLPRELMTYEPAKYRQLLQRQFQEMRQAVWAIFNHKKWANDPWQELKGDNKAFQLNLAVQTGFKIPDTLITSDPERVRNFFNAHNEDVIFKLLAASPIQDEVMYTNRLTRDFLKNIERIKSSPTIFQAYVPKAYELRITIAGDKIFPAKIYSQDDSGTALDWRRRPKLNDFEAKMEITELPLHIEQSIRSFMLAAKLDFGCFDMIVTPDGEYVFLEINPSGQWYFVQLRTEAKIGEAVADLLV